MSDGIFSGDIARNYDETSAAMFDEAVLGPTVEFLSDLAGTDRALEFAIGTGRVALPLSARGVDVCGIEMSRSMVDQLMAKPGSERIPVTIGDMATTRVDGTFGLVYLVYNTISNLLTQQAQVECFQNAATHLRSGGCFVVENLIPDLQRLPPGEVIRAHDVSGDHLGFDEYDLANQLLVSHHYWINDGCAQTFNSAHRYAWPAELDLMAQLAWMSLTQRWSNWHREPFTSSCTSHVSVWQKGA
ncbi:MAG: class SAM-dependent methyltransferase [Ilumatobacteraceae bacterium]|nr:class SAM-dependent methyltransferase [Ilumatobacteraceae bacterium]